MLTQLPGRHFSVSAIPEESLSVDFAWNDDDQYKKFFRMFWPMLNPKGGLMVFHNTMAMPCWWKRSSG
jgi:hypothetical protein